MKKTLKTIFLSLKDAVFPLKCLACQELFLRQTAHCEMDLAPGKGLYAHHTSLYLCEHCRRDFQGIESPICLRCGLMFKERFSGDHLCGDCLTKPGKISFARALGVYDRSLKYLIHALKYRGKIQVSRALSRLLYALYCQCYTNETMECEGPDIILPVPLFKKRFRQRGFNQAWLLIKDWPLFLACRSGNEKTECIKDGLVRNRWTDPQAGLDRKKRQSNIKGAFSLSSHLDVRKKHVLLIDDVYTTGATVEECAAVLMKNGARKVDVLTVSRTSEKGVA
ncbi:MAG: ComF family protein [Proteobacteria bacterium]|nr:ComF family protein [Pseudomonadota bacterium]